MLSWNDLPILVMKSLRSVVIQFCHVVEYEWVSVREHLAWFFLVYLGRDKIYMIWLELFDLTCPVFWLTLEHREISFDKYIWICIRGLNHMAWFDMSSILTYTRTLWNLVWQMTMNLHMSQKRVIHVVWFDMLCDYNPLYCAVVKPDLIMAMLWRVTITWHYINWPCIHTFLRLFLNKWLNSYLMLSFEKCSLKRSIASLWHCSGLKSLGQ